MVKPGLRFSKLQEKTIEGLVEIMIDEKLLSGSKSEIIQTGSYRMYYPHGVSHWLGMDVHDSGMVEIAGESRQLATGMVFTVEPGIYIPRNDEKAPKELRGMGIRIEDNIAVTETGYRNLTHAALKEVDEMEEVIGSLSSN